MYNYHKYMHSIDKVEPLPQIFFDKLRESFTAYSICGGMPEPATLMVDFNDMERVDSALQDNYSPPPPPSPPPLFTSSLLMVRAAFFTLAFNSPMR